MELHQLHYVRAIARTGSFTRAAEELLLAQPSLSVQVRKLEHELGIALFDRRGKHVVLTAAGEAFLEEIEPALFHLDQARRRAAAVRDLERGRVAIGVLPSVGATLLPSVLAAYRESYPGIDVALTEHNVSAEFERMVQNGQLDLAVIRAPWHRLGITGRVLIREPLVALLPPDHPLACAGAVRLSVLADEDFVGMHPGHGLRDLMDTTCLRTGGFRPRVTVESSQLAVLCGMVRAGIGVSILPRLAGIGDVAAVPLGGTAHRELAVVWRERGEFAPAAQAFLDLLTAAADGLSEPADDADPLP